jgi:hypothetical protein
MTHSAKANIDASDIQITEQGREATCKAIDHAIGNIRGVLSIVNREAKGMVDHIRDELLSAEDHLANAKTLTVEAIDRPPIGIDEYVRDLLQELTRGEIDECQVVDYLFTAIGYECCYDEELQMDRWTCVERDGSWYFIVDEDADNLEDEPQFVTAPLGVFGNIVVYYSEPKKNWKAIYRGGLLAFVLRQQCEVYR